jgi:hypothetical protein
MRKKIQCNRCAKYFPDDKKGAIHIAGCRVYNGWSTYETWLVALWIDNDHASYTYWREVAQELVIDAEDAEEPTLRRSRQIQQLAQRLEEEHADGAAERLGSISDVFVDLLVHAALAEVSWTEIAEHLLAD